MNRQQLKRGRSLRRTRRTSTSSGKFFYFKKPRHKEFKYCIEQADEGCGRVARETYDFAFTAVNAMIKLEWLVDSGSSSPMTSARDKFVSVKEMKTLASISIVNGTKISAVAMGTVDMKMIDGTSVTLSDILYIPEGSLISVLKPVEEDVVAPFMKDKCVFGFGDTTVMETKLCENVYKLKTVGGEMCHVATTRKEPWTVVHACIGDIPYKRDE